MKQPKTKRTDALAAYIKKHPKNVQKLLKEMRAAILSVAPNAIEKISYGIPTFSLHGNLVHFAAFKRHIGFYPAPSGISHFKEKLSGYKVSKGAIQFGFDQKLPLALIKRIVKFRMRENEAKVRGKTVRTSSPTEQLSKRLRDIVDALPLRPGIRVLEVGCGPGAAARAISARVQDGHVLAIDRSEKAISQAKKSSQTEISSGRLSFRQIAIEDFGLLPNEKPFDLAFAIRVGALDGRHPKLEQIAKSRIAAALNPKGRFFIDGGKPLREILLNNPTRSPKRRR